MKDAKDLRDRFLAKRQITPDKFQLDAFDAVDRGNSVLVAAPTSSGKTLVAEYAIERCLAAGDRVAYTTPIKALSNQKLRDLRALLDEPVGLLTGDNVIQPDAPALVMTTEVLRNMIYVDSSFLNELGVVVLDEVHYLQDPYRGPVWEEVIIGLPEHVRLVCLSATVTNARELANWISSVREHCEVVVETKRPVDLHEHFLVFDKNKQSLHDFPTLTEHQPNSDVQRFLLQGLHSRRNNTRGSARVARPHRLEVLHYLNEKDRLPAIVFVFSRQGCEDAVQQCLEQGIRLIDPVAQRQIREIAAQRVADINAGDLRSLHYDRWLDGLMTGVAAHHAGMVPPFKEVIEDCFAAGLLAAVFATETLALGLNMPARSVVVEQLSRFKGEGFVMLTPGEYTQLTGRAGRRGIDAIGHAHTLWSPYESFEQTAYLVASADFEIESAFRPSYNMAANLITTCEDREAAVELLNQSFAQYRADSRVPEWSELLTSHKEELKQARRRLRQVTGANKAKASKKPKKPNKAHHRQRESRIMTEARREFDLWESRVNLLENRIALAHGGLTKTFSQVTNLLEVFDCADGWQLTDSGKQLGRIFYESDLLVVLALREGLFDELNPAELAGLVSCVTYEHRYRSDPPPVSFPTAAVSEAAYAVERVSSELSQTEAEFGLTLTRSTDMSFFECAYDWAAGASLEDILGDGESVRGSKLGAQLTPGDFVRQIRGLSDVLRQIMIVAHSADTRRNARAAVLALDRGVVAVASGTADVAGTTTS